MQIIPVDYTAGQVSLEQETVTIIQRLLKPATTTQHLLEIVIRNNYTGRCVATYCTLRITPLTTIIFTHVPGDTPTQRKYTYTLMT